VLLEKQVLSRLAHLSRIQQNPTSGNLSIRLRQRAKMNVSFDGRDQQDAGGAGTGGEDASGFFH